MRFVGLGRINMAGGREFTKESTMINLKKIGAWINGDLRKKNALKPSKSGA